MYFSLQICVNKNLKIAKSNKQYKKIFVFLVPLWEGFLRQPPDCFVFLKTKINKDEKIIIPDCFNDLPVCLCTGNQSN